MPAFYAQIALSHHESFSNPPPLFSQIIQGIVILLHEFLKEEINQMSTKIHVNFTVSPKVADWLTMLKKERHINRSAYVNNLILEDLKKEQEKKENDR